MYLILITLTRVTDPSLCLQGCPILCTGYRHWQATKQLQYVCCNSVQFNKSVWNYFKGTVRPKIKNTCFFSITCSPSRLFWCELLSFGDIGHRDVCRLSKMMEVDSTFLVVLKALKNALKNWNHDLVTKDNPQTLLWAVVMNHTSPLYHRTLSLPLMLLFLRWLWSFEP